MAKTAYVYVASIDGCDSICKIGYSKNPESRVKKISNQYTRFGKARVHSKFMRSSAWKTEQTIHKILSRFRIRGEMFNVTPERASKIVDIVGDRFFHVPSMDPCEVCLSDYHFSLRLTDDQLEKAWPHAKRYFRINNIWLPSQVNRDSYFEYIAERVL